MPAPQCSDRNSKASLRHLFSSMVFASMIAAALGVLLSCTERDGDRGSVGIAAVPDPSTEGMEPRVAQRIEAARRAVLRSPDSAGAWGTFAMVCDIHGLDEAALDGYRQAARLDHSDFRWPYFLGMMLDKRGVDAAEIIQSFRQAEKLRADYAPLQVRLGDALRRLGDPEQAVEAYQRAIDLDPHSAMAHRRLGEIQLQLGQTQRALESLLRAQELTPDDAAVYVALVQAYMRSGETAKASEAAQKAQGLERVVLIPDPVRRQVAALGITGDLCYQRAIILMDSGQYAEAISNLKVKEELSPNEPDVHLRLGSCYLQTNQPGEAAQHFTRVLKLDSERAAAHLGLGIVASSAGELQRAERHLRRSLELDESQAPAHARLAVVLAQQRKLPEAVQEFERAAELGPLDARAHHNWGRLLLELNRVAEAAEHLRKAIDQAPNYADAHFLMGIALETAGQREEAIACYMKVLELEPRNKGAMQRLHGLGPQPGG